MSSPNILRDTTPVIDADSPSLAHCVITDAWGLFFAQGGVVMAAALRAMQAVLDRPDLQLSSASATFCSPVPCGPVDVDVQVLRSGRRGAQVHAGLLAPAGEVSTPNVVTTAVFTDPSLAGPTLTPLRQPDAFRTPPQPSDASRGPEPSDFPLGFLENTEWQVAEAQPEISPEDDRQTPRLAVWFRFTDPPAPEGVAWDPALLPIPGDSLGSALAVALGDGDAPVGSVSLQIGMQVFAPISGTWVGIDSTCTQVGAGLASGSLDLWSEDGVHVATFTQTAMLRTLGG